MDPELEQFESSDASDSISDTLRSDLNAALDQHGDEDVYKETPQTVDQPTDRVNESTPKNLQQPEQTQKETATGRELKPEAAELQQQKKAPAQDTPTGAQTKDSMKAPVDWGPKEREDWSRIPRHLQEKIVARERQFNEVVANTKQARSTHEAFNRLVGTYGNMISGVAGDSPMEAVENLFSTVANLRIGTPTQKAQIVANLVNAFDVDIMALDTALSGQAPQQSQDDAINQRVERLLAERLAPLTQHFQAQEQQKQQQAQYLQQNANHEVMQFAEDHEFLNDVRMEMADLIDMAAKRGVNLTLQEAYDKACMLNPQISQIINQRQQQNNLQAKRQASTSLNGQRVGNGGGGGGSLSLRDSIAAAWDSQYE